MGALDGYADWPAFLAGAPVVSPQDPLRRALAEVLGVRQASATDVRLEREWTADGVRGRELTWWVGFGPRTRAFLLEPVAGDQASPLPGVLALHAHGGVRSTGAEQLVDTGLEPHPSATRQRARIYGGRALANDLARDGFAVLVPDAFSWASRAFDLSSPSPRLARLDAALDALHRERGEVLSTDERFDELSSLHEEVLAKAAGALGATFAGAVATDDLAALDLLASLEGVDPERLGVVGFSGGGGRALFAAALDERVSAAAIGGMMATSASLIPDYLETHSWLLHSPGLATRFDLVDIAALGQQVLVQFGERDELFPRAGMTDADAHLRRRLGARYRGTWHDAGHELTGEMQDEARAFLVQTLRAGRR
ncbi:dienelactone hydrolase family protein [Microbacterium yannicii]|uniref:dienelactone hydrolase family protein n=1 Tax=Microbacterium yannicii TaxID=671622 RepID=UPI00035FD09B|nr:dienelactone hydrolase family protein [Microbacterium yannicii]